MIQSTRFLLYLLKKDERRGRSSVMLHRCAEKKSWKKKKISMCEVSSLFFFTLMEAPPPVAVAPSDFMTFVVVFASKHTTFRLPELCALAHLNGVRDLKYIYEDDEQELVAGKLERYGLGREQPSPISESGAVADAAPLSVHSKQDYEQANPFMTVFLPSIGVAERIASRSVSMKCAFLVFHIHHREKL